jgi:serine/threonine-protein kinase RsbW
VGTYLGLAMRLPRQVASVTSARHILGNALAGIGVADECRYDIAVALSEACSNAVEHAQMGQVYDVVATVGRTRCIVQVIDAGVGMDVRRPAGRPVDVTAKRGRGLPLIRALTDELEMRRADPHGVALRMIKMLAWAHDPPWRWAGVGHDPWAVVRSENWWHVAAPRQASRQPAGS